MAEASTSRNRAEPNDWVKPEVRRYSSTYTSYVSVDQLRGRLASTSVGDDTRVIIDPCGVEEKICDSPWSGDAPPYTYMYETFFTRLGLRLPLSSFECDVLNYLHLAPTQLHPNGWAFLRSFTIVCRTLGLEVSLGRFMYFFQAKVGTKVGWVSLNSSAGLGIFAAYTTSYKDFKDKFFRVRAGPACPELLVNSVGFPRFPLHWTINPKARNSFDRDSMSDAEIKDVDYLSNFKTMRCAEILRLENDEDKLWEYVGNRPTDATYAFYILPFANMLDFPM